MRNKKLGLSLSCLMLACQGLIGGLYAYAGPKNYPSNCIYQNNCGTFSVGGDWLYWKVEEEKLQVGAAVSASTTVSTVISSTVLKPKFKTESGFRVFADYLTPDNNWKVELAFSHISPNASLAFDTSLATINSNFVSIFAQNFPLLTALTSGQFNSISAGWNVKVNYLDLDLSRNIAICDNFQIAPHLGLRGEWIDQKFSIDGSGLAGGGTPAPFSFVSQMRGKLSGIGLEGGFWGSWQLGSGFAIIGHFGGSIVYARSKNNGSLTAADGGTTIIQYADSSHLSLPAMDSFIGASYKKCFRRNQLDLHIGWEHHVILDTNQFSLQGGGNLTMQGLTLGGAISF